MGTDLDAAALTSGNTSQRFDVKVVVAALPSDLAGLTDRHLRRGVSRNEPIPEPSSCGREAEKKIC